MTLITRIFNLGKCCHKISTAATVSKVGTPPQSAARQELTVYVIKPEALTQMMQLSRCVHAQSRFDQAAAIVLLGYLLSKHVSQNVACLLVIATVRSGQ